MFSYIWPIALVVLSNIVYQICAKTVPQGINPFASLTVTYVVAALASGVMFFATARGTNLVAEYKKLNAAPFLLGVIVIGLELGLICAFRAGWQVSRASIVQSSIVAVALLLIGRFAFGEAMSWNKVVGMAICLAGLVVINLK